MKKSYPTDVSDKEWTLLEPFFLPPGAPRGAGRIPPCLTLEPEIPPIETG